MKKFIVMCVCVLLTLTLHAAQFGNPSPLWPDAPGITTTAPVSVPTTAPTPKSDAVPIFVHKDSVSAPVKPVTSEPPPPTYVYEQKLWATNPPAKAGTIQWEAPGAAPITWYTPPPQDRPYNKDTYATEQYQKSLEREVYLTRAAGLQAQREYYRYGNSHNYGGYNPYYYHVYYPPVVHRASVHLRFGNGRYYR